MPRPEKVQAVAEIKERLEESRAVFLAEYAGLSVAEQQKLRRALRAADGEFRIFKMTLARLAATELGHDSLLDDLSGPTGLAFATGDAVAAAKALQDFAKEHAHLVLKGGLLGAEPLTPERVAQLAELDSRDVLLAKIAGAFQAPMAAMAGLLAAMPRNMATMLQQLIEKTPGEAPAAPADEPAAAPAAEPEASDDEATAADEADAAEGSADDAEATTDDQAADEAVAERADADPAEEE